MFAETAPSEASETAKNTTGQSFQQICAANDGANYAKVSPADGLTTSQGSHRSESAEKPMSEPFLASSQTSQAGSNSLLVSHCRECNYPAHDTFISKCPSCGTTHPFAACDAVSDALTIAEWAIAQAALTDEQKRARLADLRRRPEIAKFWARLFDPAER